MSIEYVVESEPLGTGGAIKRSMELLGEPALVMNADTLFKINLSSMQRFHTSVHADITIAARRVPDASRYGAIIMKGDRVVSMAEKELRGPAIINGGTYLINPQALAAIPTAAAFSFERDFLPKVLSRLNVAAYSESAYFIDMGVPEELARAQVELRDP